MVKLAGNYKVIKPLIAQFATECQACGEKLTMVEFIHWAEKRNGRK